MTKKPIRTKNLLYLPSCHSTNDLGLQIVRKGNPQSGQLVRTDFQTKGRGQQGSIWQSSAGKNLLISCLMPASKTPFADSIRACSAIHRALYDSYTILCKIKWPNDLFLNGRKIGGLLIEQAKTPDGALWNCIGLGLNVNQKQLPVAATSLLNEMGTTFDLDELAFDIREDLERSVLQQSVNMDYYYAHLLGYSEVLPYEITATGEHIQARIIRVVQGKLHVRTDDGRLLSFGTKEIKLLS